MKTLSFLANHGRLIALAVGLLVCGLIAYQVDATVGTKVKYQSLKGSVSDSHGRPLVGATVYFIDASQVSTASVNPAAILSGAGEVSDHRWKALS